MPDHRWILIAGLAAPLAGCGFIDDVPIPEVESLEGAEFHGGLVSIPASINGTPMRCLVDTGASAVILSTALVDAAPDAIVDVEPLVVGPWTLHGQARVMDAEEDLAGLRQLGFDQPVNCILGYAALRFGAVTIDYRDSRIWLEDEPFVPGDLDESLHEVLLAQDAVPIAEGLMGDDSDGAVVLNTGFERSMLLDEHSHLADPLSSPQDVTVVDPFQGCLTVPSVEWGYTVDGLRFRSRAIVASLTGIDELGDLGMPLVGWAGVDVLSQGAVLFDSGNSVRLFAYSDAEREAVAARIDDERVARLEMCN